MATIHPFRAWRPSPQNAKQVACVPYDVINADEARSLAKGNSKSFLHVIRPEIDLGEDTDPHDDAVYEKGAQNLNKLIDNGSLEQEDKPCIYIYRLIRKGEPQTGIFTCVSVDDYDNEIILKHELTRPDKEDDRTRHILTQSAHAEPVMMTFKDTNSVKKLMEQVMSSEDPLYDFKAEDGVLHTIWRVDETDSFEKAFASTDKLYIADGHHRCKSASRVAHEMRSQNPDYTGDEEYNFFPAVLFPMDDMNILPYNRVVQRVPENFIDTLNKHFNLEEDVDPEPSEKGIISIYLNGTWFGIKLPLPENPTSVEHLDVHRLQAFILDPLLNISDPRRDGNISFVGGIRGIKELENLVDSGKADLAISMYPTGIEELVEVSDEGLLMPPKSTWFEPKLRSGLLVHTF